MRRAKDPHKVFKQLIKAASGQSKPMTDEDRRLRLLASMRALTARSKGSS